MLHINAAQHIPASRDLRRAPDPRASTGVVMVGLLLRSVRVFGQFVWLGVGSGKTALSRPAHQRVTRAVGQPFRWARMGLFNLSEAIPMTIRPHAPEWYDRLSTLQQGYFYPWKSRLAPLNGEDTYLDLVHRYLTPETDILDVGCGHGTVALELSPHCGSILAYDRVERYIQLAQEAARKKGVENVTYLCFNSSPESNNGAARIPAEPESFDLMISRRGPLHWLEDARRVARPGAILIQLNPLETPLPQWANLLPEPLRSAAGIEYQFGMLNSVKHHLKLGGLELHSAWTYDLPEFFDDPSELYTRLSWGYLPDEVPSWSDVKSIIEQIFRDYSTGTDGLVMRHTRLLWMALVNTK